MAMSEGREKEAEERDISRVEEYHRIYSGVSLKAPQTVELRTGIIPAARYADKLRRATLAAFKAVAPREIILRDVAEFNKELYKKIVEELKIDKGDLIRIVVDATYDEKEQKITFGKPVITKFVPEDEVKAKYEEKMRRLKNEIEQLRQRIEELIKEIS